MPKKYTDPVVSFWSQVQKTETCWLWTGCTDKGGYGHLPVNGRTTGTHRFSYVLHYGSIASGLVVDHLCRVHNCVNPSHLEAVTNKENILRGEGWMFFYGGVRPPAAPRGHTKRPRKKTPILPDIPISVPTVKPPMKVTKTREQLRAEQQARQLQHKMARARYLAIKEAKRTKLTQDTGSTEN